MGLVVGITVRAGPNDGLDDLNTNRTLGVEHRQFSTRHIRIVRVSDTCNVNVAITDESSVTISVSQFEDPISACSAYWWNV